MSNINEIILFEFNKTEEILANKDKYSPEEVQNALDSGNYRSAKQYTKGLNTGSKNLQQKYNIKEKYIWNPFSSEGAYSAPDNHTIYLPFPLWNMNRVNQYKELNPDASWWSKFKSGFDFSGTSTALSRRHETDEARIGQQIAARNNVPQEVTGIHFMTPMEVNKDGEGKLNPSLNIFANDNDTIPVIQTGTHNSPQVLINEKPVSQYLSNFDPSFTNYRLNYRNASGEYGPSIQDLTPKQVRRIEDESARTNYRVYNYGSNSDQITSPDEWRDLRNVYHSKYVMNPYTYNPYQMINLTPLRSQLFINQNDGSGYETLNSTGAIQNPNAVEIYK